MYSRKCARFVETVQRRRRSSREGETKEGKRKERNHQLRDSAVKMLGLHFSLSLHVE